MKIRFRGVRGSIPIGGESTSRYGGNSSCIEVRADNGEVLVLDCGTGIRSLGVDLAKEGVEDIDILFTHFHMDHLFGFPFFVPLYNPNCHVRVTVPAYSGVDAQQKLGRYLNGIYHPLRIPDIPARTDFLGTRPGKVFERGPFRVKGVSLNHPGGSCGYRIECDGQAVVYLTDSAPMTRPNEGLTAQKTPSAPERRVLETMGEADLLIMDTMFSYEEYLQKMSWGHAYPEYAALMAETAGVKELALFHHSPDADDDQLDKLAEHWVERQKESQLRVSMAMEGRMIDLSE